MDQLLAQLFAHLAMDIAEKRAQLAQLTAENAALREQLASAATEEPVPA